jgi:hypothetical protein
MCDASAARRRRWPWRVKMSKEHALGAVGEVEVEVTPSSGGKRRRYT